MIIVPVILAGGIGERFWPLSRSKSPKQILRLISKRTMAEETLARINSFTKKNIRPLIITSASIASKLRSSTSSRYRYDLIVEPVGKNTAPAIALAAAWIGKKYGADALMLVVTADHNIQPVDEFVRAVKVASELASKQKQLVVFGIKPERPDTGYGYINLGKQIIISNEIKGYAVKQFVEKPSLIRAKQYVKSGNYMWNSGEFVWEIAVILEEFRNHMPQLYKQVQLAVQSGLDKKSIDHFYCTCEKESIDFGIMEHSERVSAVVGTFKWDDIGAWDYVARFYGKNDHGTTVVGKKIFEKDSSDSIVVNHSKNTISALGLKNVVVVATDDALLLIDREKLSALKTYLNEMKKDGSYEKHLF